MITTLGRVLRKMRIDSGELLKDMSERLEISSAMLSAIENGKRKPMEDFASRVAAEYGLDELEYLALEDAVAEQRARVSIGLDGAARKDRELAVAFARQFGTLDEDAKSQIRSILAGRKGVN
ncbi:MAG: helix-turn-helix transcriptional regulator [Atopobiaceae bacterium]|nr:helix-turn-helix transcriptional regulator [Atopobiaceae bacterium]